MNGVQDLYDYTEHVLVRLYALENRFFIYKKKIRNQTKNKFE